MIPSLSRTRGMIYRSANPDLMDNIGINEAPDLNPKMFVNPDPTNQGVGKIGGIGDQHGLPIGGITPQQPQPGQQQQQGGLPQPRQQMQPQGPQPPMGNMLNMTHQGQEMNAMQPPQMKKGGVVKHTHEIIHSKTGKVVGKFRSLKEAKSKHEAMPDMKDHEIKLAKPMAKSIDIMKAEMTIKKGKR